MIYYEKHEDENKQENSQHGIMVFVYRGVWYSQQVASLLFKFFRGLLSTLSSSL